LLNEQDLNVTVLWLQKHGKSTGNRKIIKGLKADWKNWTLLQAVNIPDGKANDDVWKIFTSVYSEIEFNDEIYVDVTHSLRNIP